jgi:hypothetical protein
MGFMGMALMYGKKRENVEGDRPARSDRRLGRGIHMENPLTAAAAKKSAWQLAGPSEQGLPSFAA